MLTGLADNLIQHGVAILQYADDTIICLKENLENARNMKILLYLYELMSGLKINFSKSEVIILNGDEQKSLQYANLFNCQIGAFPLKYLGVPISPSRLHVKDWAMLEEKNEKKLAVWKGKSLSIAGRTTLINSSLSNSSIYHRSMYLLPKTTTDKLDKQRRTFFWQGGQKRKYHLVRWENINKSKKHGGLGIKNIRKMNISLICKWWWKLEAEEGLWQSIVKRKYMQNETVGSVKHRLDDSPIWCDLLKVKHVYLKGRAFSVKNGRNTSLWTDVWIRNKPLCYLYPILFFIFAVRRTYLSIISCPNKVNCSLADG